MSKNVENYGIYIGGDAKENKIKNETKVSRLSEETQDVLTKILEHVESAHDLSEDDKFMICKRVNDFKEEASEENKKRLEKTLSDKMKGNPDLKEYLHTSGSLASLIALGLSFTGLM